MNSRHTGSDSLHPRLFIETKYKARWSVLTIWRKAREIAIKENKTPLMCLKEKGKEGFWLLVHSDDLITVARERALFLKAQREEYFASACKYLLTKNVT
jgi:hypothetical protein